MPLIKIDYNENILGSSIVELIQGLLGESVRVYDTDENKVSIFTSEYGNHYFSTAAAEIEVRAKMAEYQGNALSPNELREKHIAEYQKYLNDFIRSNKIPKGIVFTITFEDWEVRWLEGNEEK